MSKPEQILLESDDDWIAEPTEETYSKVSASLGQIQKWKRYGVGTQILDNKFLFVKKFHKHRSAQYWVNLMFVDPRPRRKLMVNWRMGFGSLALSAIAAGLFAAEQHFHVSAHFTYFNFVAISLGILGLAGFINAMYQTRHPLVFVTCTGRVPVVELVMNMPSKEAFKSYVTGLSRCIERVQQHYASRLKNQFAGELAEHRRLKDNKAISDQDYETAKNRIMSRY